MRLRRRLARLEHRPGRLTGASTLETVIAAIQPVQRWLRERGWTAQEALDREETGPAGHAEVLYQLAQADREVAAWRRQRFGDRAAAFGNDRVQRASAEVLSD